MTKFGMAFILIILGIALLMRNFGILPENLCSAYLRLARNYWPLLLILAGVKTMVGSRWGRAGEAISWVIMLLALLWLVCHLWGRQEWII